MTKVAKNIRKTFIFDPQTAADLIFVRTHMRALTASEAVRYSVRKMSEFMDIVNKGGEIHVKYPGREGTYIVDLPPRS